MTNDPARNPYAGEATEGGGFNAAGANTINGFATIGMVIMLALIGGVVGITVIMTVLLLSAPTEDQPLFRFGGDDLIFLVVGYGAFIGGAIAAVAVRGGMRGQAVAQFRSSDVELPQPLEAESPLPGPAVSLLGSAQVATIISGALLEGPAVLNAILMFLGENFAHGVPIVLAAVGLAMWVPTPGRLRQFLQDAHFSRSAR